VAFKGCQTIIKMSDKVASFSTQNRALYRLKWPHCRILLRWPLFSSGMSALGTSTWLELSG